MMRITIHTDYALRTLIYLGLRRDELVATEDISDAYGISSHHLRKVVQKLVHLGFVESIRGRTGGIRLARSPEEINIGKAARAIMSMNTLIECFSAETNQCPITPVCKLKTLMKEAQENFLKTFDDYTLDQLIDQPDEYAELLQIKIVPTPT